MARGMLLWLFIMLAETVLGTLRSLFVAPYLGEQQAAWWGFLIGAPLVLLVSIPGVRWAGVSGTGPLLGLGMAWALLTAGYELLIGVLRGLDGASLLAALDPRTGWITYTAAVMLLAPLAADWLRRRTG